MDEMWQVLRPCLLLGLHQPQVGDSVRARAAARRVALVLFPERKISCTMILRLMLFGRELGYNYEVPVSGCAAARCVDAGADCGAAGVRPLSQFAL